jgi:hypothetical protein
MEIFAKALDAIVTTPVLIAFAVCGFLFFGSIGLYERRRR